MPSCVTQIVIAVLVLYLAPAPVLPGIAPDFFLALSLLAWKLQHFPWEFLEGRVAWMRLRRYRPPRPVERRLARSVRASRPFGSLRPGPKARTDRLFTFYSTGNAHGHSYRINQDGPQYPPGLEFLEDQAGFDGLADAYFVSDQKSRSVCLNEL